MNFKSFYYFLFPFFSFLLGSFNVSAQAQFQIDSLKSFINPSINDFSQYDLVCKVAFLFEESFIDSSIYYNQNALTISKKIK